MNVAPNTSGMMARCPSCRMLLAVATPGLLPECPQCGGATLVVDRIEPTRERPPAPRTLKFDRAAVLSPNEPID
jgi:predicted RNA-binding Zn-ribbon protein involved in translation (DUF1610 family)